MTTESSNNNRFGLPKPDFQAIPKKRSMGYMIITVVLVILAVTGKVIYDVYFTDKHKIELAAPTMSKDVSTVVSNEPVSGNEAFEYKKSTKKKENISAVQKQLEEKQSNPKPLVKPGTYQELREPQGIYHLVVVSHLDKRSAMQVVHQLIKKNLGVCLILPRKGEKYYRVTIAHSRTQHEANERLKQLKPEYKDIFILRY